MFQPDHRSPADGMPAWDAPDPSLQPVATVGPGLAVQVVERRDDGWAKVLFDNGWSGWVDGRRLEPASGAASASAPVVAGPVEIGGVRITTPLVGGALVLVGALLPWVGTAGASKSAFGVPLKVLFDPKSQTAGGLKVGFVMVVLGALAVAAGLGRVPPQVGKVAGGAAVALAALFLGQLQRAIGQVQAASVFGVLGMGVYLTTAGGVLAAMAKAKATA
jgi:hypothetical protein